MPVTFDKILGKPLSHKHQAIDIVGLSASGDGSNTAISVTSDQNLTASSANVILADASTLPLTLNITLPQASTVSGKVFMIKKTDSSLKTVTVLPYPGDNIDGVIESIIIEFQNTTIELVSSGTNWYII